MRRYRGPSPSRRFSSMRSPKKISGTKEYIESGSFYMPVQTTILRNLQTNRGGCHVERPPRAGQRQNNGSTDTGEPQSQLLALRRTIRRTLVCRALGGGLSRQQSRLLNRRPWRVLAAD